MIELDALPEGRWVTMDETAEIRLSHWRRLQLRVDHGRPIALPTDESLRADMTAYAYATTAEAPSFTCPRCGAKSFNRNDIEHRYCGRCHEFVDDVVLSNRAQWDAWRAEFADFLPGEILRGFQIQPGYTDAVVAFLAKLLAHRADCNVLIDRNTTAGRWLALAGIAARGQILELRPPCNRKASHVGFL